MSRKHFIAIAASFRTQIEIADAGIRHGGPEAAAANQTARNAVVDLARDFARIAANDNPRFDTVRFLRACGIN